MTDEPNVLLARAIRHLRPDAQWTLEGASLDKLWWEGPGDPPSEAEIQAALPIVRAQIAEEERARLRAERLERLGPDYVLRLSSIMLDMVEAIYAALPETTRNRVDATALSRARELRALFRQLG